MKSLNQIIPISLLAATLTLAGCIKERAVDETNSQTPAISIDAGVTGGENTRAAVTGTTLPAGTNFGLYGYKGASVYTDAEDEGTSITLTNQPVSPAGAFVNGNVYWPTSAFSSSAMKYYAYYPYQATFGTNITSLTPSDTGLSFTYTTPAAAGTDLMYAASTSYTAIPTDGKVELTFNHILARLDVQAKLVDNTVAGTTTASITKVALGSINKTGTYTGSSDSWTGLTTTFSPAQTKTTALSTAFKSVADFMLIPQSKTGRTATITYTLNGTAGKTISVANANIPQFSEAGKRYILYITLTVSDVAVEISFDPVKVTEWGTGSSTTVVEEIEIP